MIDSFIPIGSRLSTETLKAECASPQTAGFIPIGSRLSTETLGQLDPSALTDCFIPIGSRLSTETGISRLSDVHSVELHPHRLAVEH